MNFYGNVSIKGDILQAGANKHVEIQNYYESDSDSFSSTKDDPIYALFDKLTREAIEQHPNEWKEIMKPYRSAIDAGAMDLCLTRDQFNRRFGIEVTPTAFSHWILGNIEKYQYKENENSAMISQFEALVNAKK